MEARRADPVTCSMASIKTRPPAPLFTQVFLNLCPSVKKTVRKVTLPEARGCDSGEVIPAMLGYGASTSEMVLGETLGAPIQYESLGGQADSSGTYVRGPEFHHCPHTTVSKQL